MKSLKYLFNPGYIFIERLNFILSMILNIMKYT
jgi:hypothetical protein